MPRDVILPRQYVIREMMRAVNGMNEPNPNRFGHLDAVTAEKTLDCFKMNFAKDQSQAFTEKLSKSVTIATGLTYYDLRAPALNLFPTVTPLRNSTPRRQRQFPGDSAHWKAIFATIGSGFPYIGWVPEGHRSASMSYSVTNVTLPYATLGEEDSITDEARFAAEGFEDEDALVQLRLLLKMFVKEESAILGGNATLVLPVPAAPSLGESGSTGTLPTLNPYSVICVALTQEGFLNSSLAGGVATSMTITGNDGNTYTLNGGCSAQSPSATQAITLGQILNGSVPAVKGAVAYAWYIGAVGSETLQLITTINSFTYGVPLVAGRQTATAVTGDFSGNPNYAYNGLLTTAFLAGSNAYYVAQPTGTNGAGTGLTASGVGGIVEIDTMLTSMWNNYRISPTVIYVNAQELKNITAKVLTNSSAPLLRYNVEADQAGMVEYKLTAAGVVSFYFNPYTADGGVRIPIKIHPNLAPGTLIAWCEKLPPWYVSNATPEVAEVLTRQDYYTEMWPKTTRTQFYGVYCQSALAVYAPFAMGIIDNIGNA